MDDATLLLLINTGRNIAALLVAVGVAGEFVGDFIAAPIHRRIDAARTEEIAHLTKEAADARKVSATFELDIAKANKESADALERAAKAEENLGNAKQSAAVAEQHAAEANRTAEAFRLDIAKANERSALAEQRAAQANLELEKFRSPREFGPEKQLRLRGAVSRFAGTEFDLSVSTDSEATNLANKIEECLKSAGWIPIDTAGIVNFDRGKDKSKWGIVILTGIAVEIDQERFAELGPATDVLVGTLKAEGLDARGFAVLGTTKKAIHIKIGRKP